MQRIAFFGPPGTFTEAALMQLEAEGSVAGPIERVSAASPPKALELVHAGEVELAVVPIESSVEGPVPPTLDALTFGPRLQILAETELDVAFSILARPGTTADQVRTIGAYPVAAAQVRQWLDANLPAATVVPASSNAGAAEDVVAGKVDAAVSTALAGDLLGLESLAADVVDVRTARTRFVLVGRPTTPPPRTGTDRTAVVLDLENVPGALTRAMTEFSIRDIDLTRIESRPTRTGLGTYRFHLDCIGHIEDAAVAEALKALYRHSREVRYLGSWPVKVVAGANPPLDDDASRWLDRVRTGEEAT
ncbi:prephenate dehydratase [Rhodococcus sp. D2-41]|uniref:Prephenate dehydratase n=1 Tax=Speluncibacter jeojiensis TaxID=2710754 RepID=A0A9X4LXP7_9ACTN|nr:prephenate dehydratase [Rhodococcus sp. D2-41]MDG3010467.1 prephenate dehydratase [Rhodococcus sp. D2-41]MDG3014214.1 prephenate dehydratase [Corynebacteriales bacterium D3-21]